jgi:hypothetical protein
VYRIVALYVPLKHHNYEKSLATATLQSIQLAHDVRVFDSFDLPQVLDGHGLVFYLSCKLFIQAGQLGHLHLQ